MIRQILWAVDPFCEDCNLPRRTARGVRSLATQWNAKVEPVYVLPRIPSKVRILPAFLRQVQIEAQSALNRLMGKVEVPGFLPLRVIAGPNTRLRDQADLLIRDAKGSDAQTIAISTHARKGLKRLLLGSFAETLIARSDIPLLVLNPRERIARPVRRILFCTDFSPQSREAYRRVLDLAREINASITVFHKVRCDLLPTADVAFSAYEYYRDAYLENVKDRKREAEAWAHEARELGLKANASVDYRMAPSVAEAIFRKSRTRPGLIALAAHSGSIASAILGSTTRQVIRAADSPVWVIHTEQKAASAGARQPA